MSRYLAPSVAYTSRVNLGPARTGLTGTIRFRLLDNDTTANDPVYGPSTASIIEDPSGSGSYVFHGTTPATVGLYSAAWDDGVTTTNLFYDEDILVNASGTATPVLSNLYITAAELKAARDLSGYTFADADIDRAILAASRTIDQACRRRFWLDPDATSVRYYTPERSDRLEVDDLVAVTSVATDLNGDGTYEYTMVATTDYRSYPANAAADGWPYTAFVQNRLSGRYFPCGEQSVKVTGQFGWAAVPGPVAQATLILAARYLSRTRDATYGIVSVGGAGEGTAMRISRTDPDVFELLRPYLKRIPIL